MALPDFLIIGAPKAGSTALHDALAQHPQLWAAPVKEPKYFMCADEPPARERQRGPGDAHSAREWVWEREKYERLFADAPAGALRFESTPFYLWDTASHRRIARAIPDVKVIAIIRDPVDRAFSNWTHLRADGLEPETDFLTACRDEPRRVAAGWAPFWRYQGLGRYGEQFASLFRCVDRAQVTVLRYRQLIEQPARTLDDICHFLGVRRGLLTGLPESNVGRWALETRLNHVLRRAMHHGAAAGSYTDPRVWRAIQRPLLAALQRGRPPRPRLRAAERAELIATFADDIALLGQLLDADYSDWLHPEGRGTYTERRSFEPSGAVASK